MPKGSGGRGSATTKQKWIVKGSEPQEDKPKVKAAKAEKKEEATSPQLLEKSTGPSYDRSQLLRMFNTCPREDALIVLKDPDSTEEPQKLQYDLEDRPPDDAIDAASSRRAMRSAVKAERMAKRLSTGNLEDPDEAVQTPSGGQTLDLAQATGGEGVSMTPTAAFQQWIANMTMAHASMYSAAMYGGNTTIMLRNIPNRYTRNMLVGVLDKKYKAQYDFVYLPIDFNSKCNVGYAFINFRSPQAADMFFREFNGQKTKHVLPGFSSTKVCEVSYARVQGRDQNMENLRDEKFIEKLNERPEWQPLFYDDSGKEIPFSKTLGAGSGKKKGKGAATPSHMMTPTTPTGFMYPYGPMMYPYMPPPAPPTTLASVMPTATPNTLMMLKGVPTDYTREKFMEMLTSKYSGSVDFLFLPGDAKTEGNRGFAFVGFGTKEKAKEFSEDFNGKKLCECYPDAPAPAEGEEEKTCEVDSAKMERLETSIERAQTNALQNPKNGDSWLPILISEGKEQPFPTLSAASAAAAARSQVKPQTPKAKAAEPSASSSAEAKAKQKDKKAGKKDAASPTAAQPAAGWPYGGYPYYGYPGYGAPWPGMNAAYMQMYQQSALAARAAAAVGTQAAHLQSLAAAQGHAGGKSGDAASMYSNVLDPLAAAVNPKERGPLSAEDAKALRQQVEFYFSTDNLCKDLYLRQHMGTDGWTPLELIAQFPKVRLYMADMPEVRKALSESTKFEIHPEKNEMRLADADERKRWTTTVPSEFKVG